MTMRAHGGWTCLISGGFTLFTNAVAATIGFQENRANELLVEGGKLIGVVREPILGRAAKLATLIELRESFDLDDIDTLVTGDGANDLGMIEAAGLGVAYHAKPAVAAAAAARIDHGDLTALLYAQGIGATSLWGDKGFRGNLRVPEPVTSAAPPERDGRNAGGYTPHAPNSDCRYYDSVL